VLIAWSLAYCYDGFVRVWLDDERPEPDGWVRVRTAADAISLLDAGGVEEISLDHDLAIEHYSGDYSRAESGYTVLVWLEGQTARDAAYPVPVIHVHTMNSTARRRMLAAVESIRRFQS
jgi:hypothetical protein